MELWKILASIPPILMWFGLFLYLMKAEKSLKSAEERFEEISRK
jgi:hypothetical protein